MTAFGYVLEGLFYAVLAAMLAALVLEAWRKARERDRERQRRSAGDMWVSMEAGSRG